MVVEVDCRLFVFQETGVVEHLEVTQESKVHPQLGSYGSIVCIILRVVG